MISTEKFKGLMLAGELALSGRRRCHCRAARQPRPRRFARRRLHSPTIEGPRSARNLDQGLPFRPAPFWT